MRQLPEQYESCGRQLLTVESCVVISSGEVKLVADLTFRESATEGVHCLEGASEE